MEKINAPSGLPECRIINKLIEKSNSETKDSLNYVAELERLRNDVSIQVSGINRLFPEYTPHDEKYHLKRLFYLADELLGETLIDSMNVTELFLLAVSLYAHDWGMAVSENEKDAILSGSPATPGFPLLDDEQFRLKKFCKDKNTGIKNITPDHWCEYIRLTHAFRSGKRIKDFFKDKNAGIAESASRICEGHWLDFNVIEDHNVYCVDASVNGETVNVQALAIYVRLIDLLDLGEDRTPYLLWKFVAPRNEYSKMEWAKHRCLRPVTFPKYQHGRYIRVEGTTKDHNVYMSIMDLKRYVDVQFRQSCDILTRGRHHYHKLDISHIDWHIEAEGFEPVVVQFEFDRNRMFDILSDEIYRGNPYVFIRELLQNAIDALRMREEILDKKGLSFRPGIKVEVTEREDDYIVRLSDNGIGMDEYIIKNYLSVAGKSYYRSDDFRKEGLNMDPISRFGIGILSCFMVADYIEIETTKEPYSTGKSEHLKISIPAKENYFKISKTTESAEPGTTVQVYVQKRKLPQKEASGFNVTEYLKKTAGFVKYPIRITEKGEKITICHPDVVPPANENVYQVSYAYPYEKVFLPHYVKTAKEFFTEKRFYLKEDLNLSGYEGCITFLVPKDNTLDVNVNRLYRDEEAKIISYSDILPEDKKVKWTDKCQSFDDSQDEFSEYRIPDRSYQIFMDGILLPDIIPPSIDFENKKNDYEIFDRSFVTPLFHVNIPKPDGLKIDLARTKIESTERWDTSIWKAFFDYLKEHEIRGYLSHPLDARLLSFARLLTFYRLTPYLFFENLIDVADFPLMLVSGNGKLVFQKFDARKFEFLKIMPIQLRGEDRKLLDSHYYKYKEYSGILENWKGEDVVCLPDSSYGINTSSLANISALTYRFISIHFYQQGIQFVSSPEDADSSLVVEIFKLKPSDWKYPDEEEILAYDLDGLNELHLSYLSSYLDKKFGNFPTLVRFPSPYADKLLYGRFYLNFNSELAKKMIRLLLNILALDKRTDFPKDIAAQLLDSANDIPFFTVRDETLTVEEVNKKIDNLFAEAYRWGVIGENDKKGNVKIKPDDFVPGSVYINTKTKVLEINDSPFFEENIEWGFPLG